PLVSCVPAISCFEKLETIVQGARASSRNRLEDRVRFLVDETTHGSALDRNWGVCCNETYASSSIRQCMFLCRALLSLTDSDIVRLLTPDRRFVAGQRAVQISCGADQSQMRKGLREITEMPSVRA